MACIKRGYASESSARKHLRRVKRRRARGMQTSHGKVEKRFYKCDHCRRYHLTSHDYED